ncbi:MAG: tetratricopeptide repeat protein [Gemmatales bacterium]
MSEESLFELAIRTPEGQRAALLDRECNGNPELRARVEALLRADARSSPLSKPSPALDATAGFQATASYTSPDPVPGNLIAGRYTLEQKIGEGGMGEVWVAKQSEPVKRRVALKLIKAGMDSKSVVQRFEQERQALALMDHPNIAKVLDGGLTTDRRPFFVMELVNGLALNKFCDEAKLGIRERLELFVPICQAVQHAHQKGIVHRDLKPSNILVTMIDGKPVPKVIDFGVAKATGGKLTDESMSTQFGAVIGTLEYMSPEQAGFSNQDVDTRADIYSLGVILYELLTGLRPFDSKRLKQAALDEVIRIIREEEPSKPSTKLSTDESLPSLAAVRHIEPNKLTALLRGELDWVVMKCLEKQRDRRYESANGLARDIQRYLADEVVEARPPSVRYRFNKFISRNKGPVLAAVLVMGALVAGVIGTSIGLYQAQQAAEAERLARNEAVEQKRLAEQAAEQEKQAKAQIAAQLKQIQLVNETVFEIFAGFDIRKVKAINESVEVVLGKKLIEAGRKLDMKAISDAMMLANVRHRLGETLYSLGYPQEAIELFLTARATYAEKLGPDHQDTLACMNNLAICYDSISRLDLAIPLYEETFKLVKAKFGPDHPATLKVMGNLASGYSTAKKYDLALPLLEQSFKLMKANLGSDHLSTLAAMNNLAEAYTYTMKLAQALALHEEALQLYKAKFGPDHPDTLLCMNNLAKCYHTAKKYDLALPLHEENFRLMKAKLGPDHPSTLMSMNNLAASYKTAGKIEVALPIYQDALKLSKSKFSSDHPKTLRIMNNLAEAYRAARKFDLALPLHEETLKMRKAKFSTDHPDTMQSMNNLALTCLDIGRSDLAIPLLAELLPLRKHKLGPDHPDTLTNMNNLAGCYWSLRQPDKAIPLFEELLKFKERNLGRAHQETLKDVANLGVNYLEAEKAAEAIPLLEEAFRALRDPFLRRGFGPKLLDAYFKAGRSSEAIQLFDQMLADARQSLTKDSSELAVQLTRLGSTLLYNHEYTKSEPLLREVLAIREKKEPNSWETFNTQSMLGGALLGLKKYAEAEPLLIQGYEGMKQREKLIPERFTLRLPEALDRIIQLYTETNKPDEVKKWQAEKVLHQVNGLSQTPVQPAKVEKDEAVEQFDVLYQAGKYEEAIQLMSELHQERSKYYGTDHPRTLVVLHRLGKACLANNDVPQALKHLEMAVQKSTRILGKQHWETLIASADLGRALHAAGKLDQALPALERTLSSCQAILGKDHPNTQAVMLELGEAYYDARKLDPAIVIMEELIKIGHSIYPAPDNRAALVTLARVFLLQGKYQHAEPLLREGLVRLERKAPESWHKYYILSVLGEMNMRQKKYVEAEPLLLKSYEGMKQQHPKADVTRLLLQTRNAEALDRLIQNYTETNKPDEVKKWQAEKEKLSKSAPAKK